MNAVVGDSFSLPFHFIVDREYVIPTASSVSYTLYDNDGAAVAGHTDEAISTSSDTTKVDVSIPGAVHTVEAGKDFEQRTLVVQGTFDGQTHRFQRSYFVTEFLNHRVHAEDVLTYLGLLEGEIPLDVVPLVPAYFQVREAVGTTPFNAALSSGTLSQLQVNEAIKLQAALGFLDTLELRAFRKAGGEGLSFTRVEGIDFEKLRARVRGELKAKVTALGGDSGATTLFVLSTPTDPITGG